MNSESVQNRFGNSSSIRECGNKFNSNFGSGFETRSRSIPKFSFESWLGMPRFKKIKHREKKKKCKIRFEFARYSNGKKSQRKYAGGKKKKKNIQPRKKKLWIRILRNLHKCFSSRTVWSKMSQGSTNSTRTWTQKHVHHFKQHKALLNIHQFCEYLGIFETKLKIVWVVLCVFNCSLFEMEFAFCFILWICQKLQVALLHGCELGIWKWSQSSSCCHSSWSKLS